jgi:hypothetical protein
MRSPNRSKPKVKAITNKNSPAALDVFRDVAQESGVYDAPFQFAPIFRVTPIFPVASIHRVSIFTTILGEKSFS